MLLRFISKKVVSLNQVCIVSSLNSSHSHTLGYEINRDMCMIVSTVMIAMMLFCSNW